MNPFAGHAAIMEGLSIDGNFLLELIMRDTRIAQVLRSVNN